MTNKISNESLLLHNNCTKMLRRPSRQLLIIDVLTKMNILNKEPEEISLDKISLDKISLDKIPLDKIPLDKIPLDKIPLDKIYTEKNNTKNISFFEKFLQVICCKID